jgi:hypothetical protein
MQLRPQRVELLRVLLLEPLQPDCLLHKRWQWLRLV